MVKFRIRLNRKNLEEKIKEYVEDGDHKSGRLYHHFAIGPNYVSC